MRSLEELEEALARDDVFCAFAFHYLAVAGSTQDVAKEYLRRSGKPILAMAGRQTAGRGRCGREWFGEAEGNIYLSMGIDRMEPSRDSGALAMGLAVKIAGQFREKYAIPLVPKPPNDLLLNGKKVGGILLETLGSARAAVLGIGLNLVQDDSLQGRCAQPVGSIGAIRRLERNEVALLLCLAAKDFIRALRSAESPPSFP
jgi:biotin-[acetyl-CoA-carboxylase] ligase BirA-like protein